MHKKRKRMIWIVVFLAVLGVLGGVVLPRGLELAITRFTEVNLQRRLDVETGIGHVHVSPWARGVAVYGLRVGQPRSYGDGDLLYLPEARLRLSLVALLAGRIELDGIEFRRARLNVRVGDDGANNLRTLGRRWRQRETPRPPRDEGEAGFPVRLRSLAVIDSEVGYHDRNAKTNAVDFTLVDVNLEAEGLRAGVWEGDVSKPPGLVRGTARLRKPPLPDGRLGLVAEVGTLGRGWPDANGSIRMVGLELAALAPYLPTGTAAVLGGNAMDVAIDLRGSEEFLDGRILLDTIAGYHHGADVHGTPSRPRVGTDDNALTYVVGRSGGTLGNTLGNVFAAGKGAVDAATDTATGLARLTARTVGSFGSGLLKVFSGIFRFRGSRIKRGFIEMGTALTGGAKDAVFTTTGDIMKGVGTITGNLSGDESARTWRADVPRRWEAAWRDAIDTVDRAPFPPVKEER